MSSDISKPTTTRTKQDVKNYEENWDRIFGKRDRLKKQLAQINLERHNIINSLQAKRNRSQTTEDKLEVLKKKRTKIIKELDRLK